MSVGVGQPGHGPGAGFEKMPRHCGGSLVPWPFVVCEPVPEVFTMSS